MTIRFILKRRVQDTHTGLRSSSHQTIDLDVPELEALLTAGGQGPAGYDVSELAGVEVLDSMQDLERWHQAAAARASASSADEVVRRYTVIGDSQLAHVPAEARGRCIKALRDLHDEARL